MNLEPVTVDHYDQLKPFFADQHHRLSAYCLTSIIAWQTCFYQPQFTVDAEGWLVVAAEFFKSREKRHLLLPIRPGWEPESAQLHRLALDAGFDCFWFVPEAYVQARLPELERYFSVSEQDGFHDYIYRQSDLAELPGRGYHKKRNLIRQFTSEYVQSGRVEVAVISPADVPACLEFLDQWCEERDCGVEDVENDLACEKIAAMNALAHLSRTEARGLLIRVDGTVSAFAVGARLTADMGVLMFEKAFAGIKGLYQYLDRACARRLFEEMAFINKESDMGIPGLRQAKRSYHPVAISKSYMLTLR
jgi:hypothetical protein